MDEIFNEFVSQHRAELLAVWHATEKEIRRAIGSFGDFAFAVMMEISNENHRKLVDAGGEIR